MNWSNIFGLTAGALILFFAALRVERRRLNAILFLLVIPGVIAIALWANFRHQWAETLLSFAVAGVVAGAWWGLYGRKSPRPTSDNIKVWGQDSALKPKPAEMQAEILRLKEEKERLEAELRRLREGKNGQGEN